jgi:hypothetical protein
VLPPHTKTPAALDKHPDLITRMVMPFSDNCLHGIG